MFANFTDGDLDPSRRTATGVRALRTYIAFARSGTLDAAEVAARDNESPFEDAVARALSERGHLARRQIGQAGCFVDTGIADPERPGKMVLGVECDGNTYHASRSARDRDRLRHAVVEGPVHTDDAYRRVAAGTGISRVGKPIRAHLDQAVHVGVAARWFGVVDECLVPKGFGVSSVRPRDRSALAARDRSFAGVPTVDLDAAIITVVGAGHGVPRHEVPPAVTRLLGFGRATEDVQASADDS